MRFFLITILSLLLFSFLTSCEKKEETLYHWKTSSGWEWKKNGNINKHPQYKGEVNRKFVLSGDYIREGFGIMTYPDGTKYEGEFKDGLKNGPGTETYKDGEKYQGDWRDGLRNGYGTFIFPNGTKYEGEFKDGLRNGQGTLILSNGIQGIGEWKDGKPWNITEYNKNGDTKGRWMNGAKQ